jgi:hypothetical protein
LRCRAWLFAILHLNEGHDTQIMNFTRDAIEKHGFDEVGELLQTEKFSLPEERLNPFHPC